MNIKFVNNVYLTKCVYFNKKWLELSDTNRILKIALPFYKNVGTFSQNLGSKDKKSIVGININYSLFLFTFNIKLHDINNNFRVIV